MSNEAKAAAAPTLADAIATLRKELSLIAHVAEKGTPQYEELRKPGWNKSVDAHPTLIIRCTDTRDVSLAVKFCRSQKLPFTSAGGRHSSVWIKNDHVLIDLGGMRGVIVDAPNKIVHVQGGARNEDVDHAGAAYGLYTPMGHYGDTGVGGLVSAGGVGHMSRKFGLAIDNLVSVELVDYQGQVLQASDKENSDLFWAVRGAAHNFGVVTRFSLRLHTIGHVPKPNDDIPAGSVLGGLVLHPIEDAPEAFKRFEAWNTNKIDNATSGMVVMGTIPTGELKCIVNPVYIGDDVRKGLADVEPLVNWGTVQLNVVRPQTYFELQHQADHPFAEGKWYERAALLSKLSDEAIAGLVKLYTELPRGKEHRVVGIQNLGGKIAELPEDSSAFGHRTAARFWCIIAVRYEEEDKATAISFVEKIRDFLRAHDCGSFSNSMNGVELETAQAAFGRSADRLRELKAKYDPENVFNTNIRLLAARK